MELSLRNKKVFVSGSSKGIGLCIAERFIEEGADVVINSRNLDELVVKAASLGGCKSVAGDLRSPEAALVAATKAAEILGGIDIVVCNVGSGSSVPPGQETYSEWRRVFDINFFSATNLIESSHGFLAKSQGSIVCISSICGIETIPGAPITYSVAKAALNAYVKSMSVPFAQDGIRINAVAPGNINFEGSVWSKKIIEDPDAVERMLERDVPFRRFGSPEDVASIVAWLSSDAAKFVTGAIFTTDGGQTRS